MTDTPDIEALVATLRGKGVLYKSQLEAADALERLRAVVKAARAWKKGYYFEDRMRKALAALDAPPKGEG